MTTPNHSAMPDSLWKATARPAPQSVELTENVQADVAIVGGGFTGLRAALWLASAGTSVVVLEANEPGWGASGRNGGQVNPMGHKLPAQIAAHVGSEYADRIVDMMLHSANEVFELIRHHDIDCDVEQNGWIRTAHSAATARTIRQSVQAWQPYCEHPDQLQLVEGEQLHALTGTTAYQTGLVASQAGSVHPLNFARGLATAAVRAGVRLFSNARVQSMRRHDKRWTLASGEFSVTTDQVILATNGYTDSLWPGLRESVIPFVSLQAASKPLPEALLEQILPHRHTFADTRRTIYYGRKDRSGRLLFGSLGVDDKHTSTSMYRHIAIGIAQAFPFLKDIEWEFHWGGRIAHTPDYLPHLHEPAPGVLAGLGYNGRGVAMSNVMGRILAQRALGSGGQLPLPVTTPRRIPFRNLMTASMPAAIRWFRIRDRIDNLFF